jgi:hypothetical protein
MKKYNVYADEPRHFQIRLVNVTEDTDLPDYYLSGIMGLAKSACFDTPEEAQQMVEQLINAGNSGEYYETCPDCKTRYWAEDIHECR